MILFSGALLLTPGFFTDIVGFLLLVPQVRKWLFEKIRKRIRIVQVERRNMCAAQRPGDEVVEGEYHVNESESPPRDPSGWTRH